MMSGPDAYERELEQRRRLLPAAAVVRWPYRCADYSSSRGGYVVWRDVFEGAMRCSEADAIEAHKQATFVCEADALDYCAYRNEATARLGTDDVTRIHPEAHR